MDMTVSNNAAFLERDNALGTDDGNRGRAGNITRFTHGGLYLEHEGIGQRDLDLACLTQRAQNTHVFDRAHGRTDNCQGFLTSILTGLGEILDRGQLISCAEQNLKILLTQVNVSVGDTYGNACILCSTCIHFGNHLLDNCSDIVSVDCHFDSSFLS